ncbi:hypothetical protein D3C71_950030 [compost metagenome]
MAQVANQRAVGLTQRDAAACALIVIGLGHIQRNRSAVVARQHRRTTGHLGQKFKNWSGAPGGGLQAQAGQAVKQAPLGGLDLHPAAHVRGLRQIGQHPGLAARDTQFCIVVGRHGKVAGLVFGMVAAHTVQATAVIRATAPAPAAPQVGAILRRRRQGRDGQHIGQKCQRAATVQTLHAVEKNQMTAMVAIEYPHGVELIPGGVWQTSKTQGYACWRPMKKAGPRRYPEPAQRSVPMRYRQEARSAMFRHPVRDEPRCCCALHAHSWCCVRWLQPGSFQLATWQSPRAAPCR